MEVINLSPMLCVYSILLHSILNYNDNENAVCPVQYQHADVTLNIKSMYPADIITDCMQNSLLITIPTTDIKGKSVVCANCRCEMITGRQTDTCFSVEEQEDTRARLTDYGSIQSINTNCNCKTGL